MNAAKLNWEPKSEPIFLANGQQIPDKKAILRSDTNAYIATVGDGYESYGNGELYDLLQTAANEEGVGLTSFSSRKGGAVIMASLDFDKPVDIMPGDVVVTGLQAFNAHDGSGKLRLMGPYTKRLVCSNGLMAIVNSGVNVAIMHTTSLRERLEEVKLAIRQSMRATVEFHQAAKALAAVSMTDTRIEEYFRTVYPAPKSRTKKEAAAPQASSVGLLDAVLNQQNDQQELVADMVDKAAKRHAKLLEQVLDIYHNDKNAGRFGENLWTGVNAVTEHTDHFRSTRGTDDTDRTDNQVISTVWGSGAEIKARAWNTALAMA